MKEEEELEETTRNYRLPTPHYNKQQHVQHTKQTIVIAMKMMMKRTNLSMCM